MFTGIIKKVSKVMEISQKDGSFFVWLEKPGAWKLKAGDSIAINGVCSTVRVVKKDKFEVEYMPETLKKTTAGSFKKDQIVNLEKSLRMSDLLDGHIVQGHVDCVGEVNGPREQFSNRVRELFSCNCKILKIKVPRKFMKFIAPKGSAAIDGISLTVVDTGKDWFSVSLVSYTIENTNLKYIKKGDRVNIETDVIAKYIVNYLGNS